VADPGRRLAGNVAGDFYVDATCIDCDQCRVDGRAPVRLAADLLVIPTPGHTRGHHVLLYRG
jgi:glyoxylase-like metal-dependent hydrolase (beta-lactamase superfamily II)